VERLYDKLVSYQENDYYPMHMPGHKRNTEMMQMVNPYSIDITEIEGFDNLHKAEGILKQLSQRLSSLYQSEKSYPLVNGSTVGILAGICAATHRGDKVLIARNCHKSVYHALVLNGLNPVYYYPPMLKEIPVYGGISEHEIEKLLIEQKEISLVVITSPTYEGMVSDVEAIARVVHRHHALLLVDEAHGAHLGFHKGFPKSSVQCGADIVIQSLHKTLPAFTQSAVLHSNRSFLNNKIEQYLTMYESSSPSYVLMAGMDRCVSVLEDHGADLFDAYHKRLDSFYQSMKQLRYLKVIKNEMIGINGIYDLDSSKITINVSDGRVTGHELCTLLKENFHIIMEMETPDYVLGMTSICDTEEGFGRLRDALLQIDNDLSGKDDTDRRTLKIMKPIQIMLPWQAFEHESEQIRLSDSCGRISGGFIGMYPPGAPILVPGERIDEEMIRYLDRIRREGITITGLKEEDKKIDVLVESPS